MTDTVTSRGDADLAKVEAALEQLLSSFDPKQVDDRTFRGARYDQGLAWVHFPVGFGGLGVRPELNRLVEERVRKAGAAPQDPSTFFIALAGPTIVTHGTDEVKQRFLRPMFTGRGALVPAVQRARARAATSPASARAPSATATSGS